jgi:SAM-dependent methyltransferase
MVRLFKGLGYLPKFSIRTRSIGISGHFGGVFFAQRGETLTKLLVDHAALKKDDVVFEIGCGSGCAAFALARRLDDGHYTGIDIDQPSINACLKNSIFMNKRFAFIRIDIRHPFYNPSGVLSANQYRMPCSDGGADIVFLISVFTHMLPDDVSGTIHEIGRILKPGGRCLFTTFLMDHGTDGFIGFPIRLEKYCLNQERNPEKAVGYYQRFFEEQFGANHMTPVGNALLGHWRSATDPKSSISIGQDAMVFVKI